MMICILILITKRREKRRITIMILFAFTPDDPPLNLPFHFQILCKKQFFFEHKNLRSEKLRISKTLRTKNRVRDYETVCRIKSTLSLIFRKKMKERFRNSRSMGLTRRASGF